MLQFPICVYHFLCHLFFQFQNSQTLEQLQITITLAPAGGYHLQRPVLTLWFQRYIASGCLVSWTVDWWLCDCSSDSSSEYEWQYFLTYFNWFSDGLVTSSQY